MKATLVETIDDATPISKLIETVGLINLPDPTQFNVIAELYNYEGFSMTYGISNVSFNAYIGCKYEGSEVQYLLPHELASILLGMLALYKETQPGVNKESVERVLEMRNKVQ